MAHPDHPPERPAGAGIGADRSPPGVRSDSRPARRPIYVDLDWLYGRGPASSTTTTSATSAKQQPDALPEKRSVSVGVPPEGFESVDGVAAVRHPGRLICAGEVSGVLHRWERAHDGAWIAIVSFLVPFTKDDPRPGQKMDFVAVAAAAVRPREPGSPGPAPALACPDRRPVARLTADG